MPDAVPESRSTLVLYGIPNCDQVKKARRWLDERAIEYRFHDFRRDGLERATVERWLQGAPWDTVINTRGTTWRGLAEDARPHDASSAATSALEQPSLIKRPVLEVGNTVQIGYAEAAYAALFG